MLISPVNNKGMREITYEDAHLMSSESVLAAHSRSSFSQHRLVVVVFSVLHSSKSSQPLYSLHDLNTVCHYR